MRMWRAHRSAKRPWPVMDDDDVIDYYIMEALAARDADEEQKERDKEALRQWKADKKELHNAVNN